MNISDYIEMLLEKDHRSSMLKFGMSEDVAEYLHEFDDKYSIWFANQIKVMDGYKRAVDKLSYVRNVLRNDMRSILDWVKGVQNINIKSFNWETALSAARKWHDDMAKDEGEQVEDLKGSIVDDEGEILKVYKDGFYWIDLGCSYSKHESSAMGHCGRSGSADTLFSLRHGKKVYKKGYDVYNSYVTLAISPNDGKWHQCKGKGNQKPNEEYFPYIVDILAMSECFEFSSEYQSSSDFKTEDFKEFLEEHPEFLGKDRSEEIIVKLVENSVTFEDFEKLLENFPTKNYKFSFFEEDYVMLNVTFDYDLLLSRFPELEEYFVKNEKELTKQYSWDKDLVHAFEQSFDVSNFEELRIERGDDGIWTFHAYIQIDSNSFEMSKDGLHDCRRVLDTFYRDDKNLQKVNVEDVLFGKMLDSELIVLEDGFVNVMYEKIVIDDYPYLKVLEISDSKTSLEFVFDNEWSLDIIKELKGFGMVENKIMKDVLNPEKMNGIGLAIPKSCLSIGKASFFDDVEEKCLILFFHIIMRNYLVFLEKYITLDDVETEMFCNVGVKGITFRFIITYKNKTENVVKRVESLLEDSEMFVLRFEEVLMRYLKRFMRNMLERDERQGDLELGMNFMSNEEIYKAIRTLYYL